MTSAQTFELPSIAFFGRTYREYIAFLGLNDSTLPGARVLDVAAGPSSFTVEATGRGVRATAVDPLYGMTSEALAGHVQIDYRRVLAEIRAKAGMLSFGYFPTIEAAEESRREAARRFLEDYEGGFAGGRYVGGSLPRLPFGDRAFDVVLCAHFLFLYQRFLDYEGHLRACLEMCRVSAGEVRIHPVCSLDGLPYAYLDRLRADLSQRGISSEVIPVAYGFFAGTGSTLILRS